MSVEEKLNQAKGAIKEGVGKITDDKKTEKEGAAEKVCRRLRRGNLCQLKKLPKMPKRLLKGLSKALKIWLKRTINSSKID